MTIYELSYSWYEEYSPILFKHADLLLSREQWRELCDSLLDEAAARAVKEMSEREVWVGWNEIVNKVADLLKQKGFIELDSVKSDYFGSCIIDSEDEAERLPEAAKKLVLEYNKNLRSKLHEEDGTEDETSSAGK
jgi:hypothetical protein